MGNQLYLPMRRWEAMIRYRRSEVTEGAEIMSHGGNTGVSSCWAVHIH